jgi:hypothetical protein
VPYKLKHCTHIEYSKVTMNYVLTSTNP